MRILLDTHVFLWLQTEPERLGEQLELVEDTTNVILLSAASAWEVALKAASGRLQLPEPAPAYVRSRMNASGLSELPVTHAHATHVATLPRFDDHTDPFDRLLIATAQVESVPVLTFDQNFERYDVELIRRRSRRRRRRR